MPNARPLPPIRETIADFVNRNITAVPEQVWAHHTLLHLKFAHNRIARFPGGIIAKELQRLQIIELQDNSLFVLEDLIPLAALPHLWKIDLRENPLRLLSNRIYLLERFFQTVRKASVQVTAQVAVIVPETIDRVTAYRRLLPRCCGFPMLQFLNESWITDMEIEAVELELGWKFEYQSLQKVKKIRKQNKLSASDTFRARMQRPNAPLRVSEETAAFTFNRKRQSAIPSTRTIERCQFDCSSGSELTQLNALEGGKVSQTEVLDSESADEILSSLLKPLATCPILSEKQVDVGDASPSEPSANLLSGLTCEEVNYVRLQSRVYVGENQENKSTSFDKENAYLRGSILLDAVAQMEKSLRLIKYANERLSPNKVPLSLTPSRVRLDRKSHRIRRNRETSFAVLDTELDHLLANLKVANATDVRNIQTVQNVHHEKILIQSFIENERRVVAEERLAQELEQHRHRLSMIALKKWPLSDVVGSKRVVSFASPWQERDYKAKNCDLTCVRVGQVEMLEDAENDTLTHVNSQQLMVRTAEIRMNAKENLLELERFWRGFQLQESEWETKRQQDPISRIRRRLQRRYNVQG